MRAAHPLDVLRKQTGGIALGYVWVCPGLLVIGGGFLILTAEKLSLSADESAPADFRRFDVGAFLMTFFWAFTHGLFRWAGAFLLLEALSGIAFILVRESPSLELHISHRATSLAIWLVLAFVFARRARLLHWRSMRGSDAEPPANLSSRIERVRRGRVYWLVAGVVFLALGGYMQFDRWARLIG